MANPKHLEILKQGVTGWNKWRGESDERPELGGAELSGSVLNRFDLNGSNLSHANLRRADLIRADIKCADLRKAELTSAILSRSIREGGAGAAYWEKAGAAGAEVVESREKLWRCPRRYEKVSAEKVPGKWG